jgi:hypothetical protein
MSVQQSFLQQAWLRGYRIPQAFSLQHYGNLERDPDFEQDDMFRLRLKFQGKFIASIFYNRSTREGQSLWYTYILVDVKYQHLALGPKLIFGGDAVLLEHVKGRPVLRYCDMVELACRDFARFKRDKIAAQVSETAIIYRLP